jgi:hypothetical protein
MVYFIKCNPSGRIKIGYSKEPTKRMASLQIGCPDELELMGTIHAPKSLETVLKRAFRDFRIRGEWHTPSKELLCYIESYANKNAR